MLKKLIGKFIVKSSGGATLLRVRDLLRTNGYLRETGWFESAISRMPVDHELCPLPWYTYGAIEFLSERVMPEMLVFEYGSGNSTLWWSDRVSRVISVEHDEKWFYSMESKMHANVEYFLLRLDQQDNSHLYVEKISQYKGCFDIIVIDGRRRVECARNSVDALKNDGVIVWDNSDRDKDAEGYRFLGDKGFRQLNFHGFGPINAYGWCTSVFYRKDNCFGI